MKNYKKTAYAVLGLSVALLGGGAQAAVSVDGAGWITATGSNVTYEFAWSELEYFAGFSAPVDLSAAVAGAVSVSGDSLVLTLGSFRAESGGTTDVLRAINISVSANDLSQFRLSSFSLDESGQYFQGAAGDVSPSSLLQAVDGAHPNGTSLEAYSGLPSLDVVGAEANWSAQAALNVPAPGWNTAVLTLTNYLSAYGTDAWIDKDLVSITTIATPVPEADTYLMMLAGLGLVGFMARRTRTTI